MRRDRDTDLNRADEVLAAHLQAQLRLERSGSDPEPSTARCRR